MTQTWGDGSKARIPMLVYKVGKVENSANLNSDKGHILAKVFFLDKPPVDSELANYMYPEQCKSGGSITSDQISIQLKKLKPYKAPGPDGIPNIVLTKNADLIVNRMLPIYKAMLKRSLMYKPWKEFVTVVLRKPGKLRYNTLKTTDPLRCSTLCGR